MKEKIIVKILSLSKYVIRIDKFDSYLDEYFINMKMYYVRLINNKTLPFGVSSYDKLKFRCIPHMYKVFKKEGSNNGKEN